MDPGSIAFLTSEGFEGFRTLGMLYADSCEEIPSARGVYAIVRESLDPPRFLPKSTAPTFRGADPTLSIDELEKRWVPGAQVLYLGRARGPGVRSLLKQRVKRMLRFGYGRLVAHWDGRVIWQLADRAALRAAWKPTHEDDPAAIADSYREAFERHFGSPPFANREPERDD